MCKSEDWVIFFFTATAIWILMCHILKKNGNLTCKVWSEIADGREHTYVHQWLNWNGVCMSTSVAAGRPVCIQTCTRMHTLNILFLQHKGAHPEIFQWQAPLNCWPGLAFWTIPAEILSPSQEHLCKRQILRPDTQWCHCCAGLLTDGWGIKNREAEMPLVWLFKASSPVCYAQRATSAAGSSQRSALGSLCGCVHCAATTKRF